MSFTQPSPPFIGCEVACIHSPIERRFLSGEPRCNIHQPPSLFSRQATEPPARCTWGTTRFVEEPRHPADDAPAIPAAGGCPALTDNAHNPAGLRDNVLEIATDYLAVGIDPNLTTICLQSHLPALADLTLLYMNFVTVARLERNPTIKDKIQARGFGGDIPAGFLCYPVAQAADITGFKATIPG